MIQYNIDHRIQYCIIRYNMRLFKWCNIIGIVIKEIPYINNRIHQTSLIEVGEVSIRNLLLWFIIQACRVHYHHKMHHLSDFGKDKANKFYFVRNNLTFFVLALQNEQNPPVYGLHLVANSGTCNLCNSDIKLLFIGIITYCLPFHDHFYN